MQFNMYIRSSPLMNRKNSTLEWSEQARHQAKLSGDHNLQHTPHRSARGPKDSSADEVGIAGILLLSVSSGSTSHLLPAGLKSSTRWERLAMQDFYDLTKSQKEQAETKK